MQDIGITDYFGWLLALYFRHMCVGQWKIFVFNVLVQCRADFNTGQQHKNYYLDKLLFLDKLYYMAWSVVVGRLLSKDHNRNRRTWIQRAKILLFQFQKDGSGYILWDELIAAFEPEDAEDRQEAMESFKMTDRNGDGKVSKDEFVQFMSKSFGRRQNFRHRDISSQNFRLDFRTKILSNFEHIICCIFAVFTLTTFYFRNI